LKADEKMYAEIEQLVKNALNGNEEEEESIEF